MRWIDFRPGDCTLNLDQFQHTINERTRLVAVGCASNATGGINPVRQIADWAHSMDALVYLDAVHYAPHALLDVQALGADFLACSAYKFFGPHIGILWGKRDLLEQIDAYKVRPAPDSPPGKWMTGTQNHEGISGVLGALEYFEWLAGQFAAEQKHNLAEEGFTSRRLNLKAAMTAIRAYEFELSRALIEAIENGRLSGAALDVFDYRNEVNPRLLELARNNKVVLTAHMGSATLESRIEMGETVIVNIRAFLDGHTPPNRVLPERPMA